MGSFHFLCGSRNPLSFLRMEKTSCILGVLQKHTLNAVLPFFIQETSLPYKLQIAKLTKYLIKLDGVAGTFEIVYGVFRIT